MKILANQAMKESVHDSVLHKRGAIPTTQHGDQVAIQDDTVLAVRAVVGVLIASYAVKTTGSQADSFAQAWFYVVLLSLGYLGSRGLSKSGGGDHYDA